MSWLSWTCPTLGPFIFTAIWKLAHRSLHSTEADVEFEPRAQSLTTSKEGLTTTSTADKPSLVLPYACVEESVYPILRKRMAEELANRLREIDVFPWEIDILFVCF